MSQILLESPDFVCDSQEDERQGLSVLRSESLEIVVSRENFKKPSEAKCYREKKKKRFADDVLYLSSCVDTFLLFLSRYSSGSPIHSTLSLYIC